MKIKTSELTGQSLDWAVCIAGNPKAKDIRGWIAGYYDYGMYKYSTDWGQGGTIIEREGIELLCNISASQAAAFLNASPDWFACLKTKRTDHWHGPTPLIAAMRCYVASRLGEEIEVPDELDD